MAQMTRIDNHFAPPSPGEVLREKVIEGMGLTQSKLARAIGISRPRLNMILKGRCQFSAEIALRVGRATGISPQSWLRVRAEFELWEETQRMALVLDNLPQLQKRNEALPTAWAVEEWKAAA